MLHNDNRQYLFIKENLCPNIEKNEIEAHRQNG
jgi:hypothetical protein